jgi:hypothetical protein
MAPTVEALPIPAVRPGRIPSRAVTTVQPKWRPCVVRPLGQRSANEVCGDGAR